jgi:hypothetical protein
MISLVDYQSVENIFSSFSNDESIFGPIIGHPFGGFDRHAPEERAELASLLSAVQDAGDRFCMVSLGAAPGEWPIKAERAYKRVRSDGAFQSFSLEGDLDHFEMTKNLLALNGVDIANSRVFYQVIADRDGWAYFPIINPEVDWGAGIAAISDRSDDLDGKIAISTIAKEDRIAANFGKPLEFRTVEAVSLETLFGTTGAVDYLHCDIQGAESDVFPGHMDAMTRNVRVACVATHGRQIEQALINAFDEAGWVSECAFPCKAEGEGETERVFKDGVFVWSNPNSSS